MTPAGRRKHAASPGGAGPDASVGSGPRAIRDVLSELFARRGFAQVQAHEQWQQVWAEVAGREVAEHSRVIGLRRGRLEIALDSSVLLQELATFRRAELLTSLRQRMPGVSLRDLRFRAGAVD